MAEQSKKLIKITIDDQVLEVGEGIPLLLAALKQGIEIPHFCYHPSLSIDGSCRMCQVEVEGQPKLAIACNTPASEGLVVRTQTEKVKAAQNAVLEFLLLNHPLDCPICDQAGECPLQDFAYLHGPGHSRSVFPRRKLEKRKELGPHVVLDQERCILCRRCVRFCREITKTDELGVFNRGDYSVLDIYPGRPLTNRYSGCTVDICPVGALTLTEFRFQARVWDMTHTPSICPGCANGCNIYIGSKGDKVLRIIPRINDAVNGPWICDDGRLGYHYVNATDRLRTPLIRREDGLVPASWDEALAVAAEGLRAAAQHPEATAGLSSPQCTNEEQYLFMTLFKEVLKSENIGYLPHLVEGDDDGFLIRADKAPNAKGAEVLGIRPRGEEILNRVLAGQVKYLFIMGENPIKKLGARKPGLAEALERLDFLMVQEVRATETAKRARVVLPAASFAEKGGTFTNYRGIVQRIYPAISPPGQARADWRILLDLLRALGHEVPFAVPAQILQEMAKHCEFFRQATPERFQPTAPFKTRIRPSLLYLDKVHQKVGAL